MHQLLLHLIGDYIVQNDWMALNKKKPGRLGFFACLVHCITYSVPFLLITDNLYQFAVIFVTHFIIDRWHLVDWFLAIRNGVNHIDNFGFSTERPGYISIWLYIITDNVFHVLINFLALTYLR